MHQETVKNHRNATMISCSKL